MSEGALPLSTALAWELACGGPYPDPATLDLKSRQRLERYY